MCVYCLTLFCIYSHGDTRGLRQFGESNLPCFSLSSFILTRKLVQDDPLSKMNVVVTRLAVVK